MAEFKQTNSDQNKVLVKDKAALFEDAKSKDELNKIPIIALSALLTLMLFVSVNDISRILLFWN